MNDGTNKTAYAVFYLLACALASIIVGATCMGMFTLSN